MAVEHHAGLWVAGGQGGNEVDWNVKLNVTVDIPRDNLRTPFSTRLPFAVPCAQRVPFAH